MHDDKKYYVESEIGTLRKLIIHSPDGGIGKIIPSTFSDNLYDDIVHLKKHAERIQSLCNAVVIFS